MKTNIFYPLTCTCKCAYKGVNNIFQKIGCVLFSCNSRFEILPFALLPIKCVPILVSFYLTEYCAVVFCAVMLDTMGVVYFRIHTRKTMTGVSYKVEIIAAIPTIHLMEILSLKDLIKLYY